MWVCVIKVLIEAPTVYEHMRTGYSMLCHELRLSLTDWLSHDRSCVKQHAVDIKGNLALRARQKYVNHDVDFWQPPYIHSKQSPKKT